MGRIEEILLILVVALFFFGKDKLPGLGKAIGQFMDEFKKASSGQGAKEEPKTASRPEAAKPMLALPPSEAEKAAKRRKKAPAKKKKAKVKAKR
jgi:sec-independent protein translocase protein TatA